MRDGSGTTTTATRLRPGVDTRVVRVEDEAVVFQDEDGPLHGLNSTGLVVWEQLDGDRTLGEVIDALAQRFDCPPEAVTDDVVAFAGHLVDQGLLELVANRKI